MSVNHVFSDNNFHDFIGSLQNTVDATVSQQLFNWIVF